MSSDFESKSYFQPILSCLHRLVWRGEELRQASACCPSHDDQTPSLSVSFGRDGRLVLKCWAGCSISSICEALGIKPQHLFLPNQTIPRTISAIYDYTDEIGTVLYQKVRYEPKHFLLRKNAKCWDINNVRRVLYKLPDVLSDGESGVLVLEGERDVETANWLGFASATTSCESSRWLPEYSMTLAPFPVCIIPHNDSKGIIYASEVAESLAEHGCESIKIVELAAKGRGADLSSWIDDQDSAISRRDLGLELADLIRDAPRYAEGSSSFIAIDIRCKMMSIKTEMARIDMLVKEFNRCQKQLSAR